MNICLIGVSGHTGYVLNGLSPHGIDRLIGIAPGSPDEDADSLAWHDVVKAHQPEVCDDYRLMIDRLKPDVVVVICHFCDHAAVTRAALERGCHVLCEKPLATELADLANLKILYDQAGVHLSAMHSMRYNPAYYTAHEYIVAGAIGEIRLLNAEKSYKLGSRPVFFKTRDTYGGTIPWIGIHAIDLLAWFAPNDFTSVCATHSALHNRDHGDLEISAHCFFTFTGGVSGVVSVDYLRPENASTHSYDRFRLVGTTGVIEVSHDTVTLENEATTGEQTIPPICHRHLFADFLNQIRGTGSCLVSAADVFRVTEVSLLTRQSADEGQPISFAARR